MEQGAVDDTVSIRPIFHHEIKRECGGKRGALTCIVSLLIPFRIASSILLLLLLMVLFVAVKHVLEEAIELRRSRNDEKQNDCKKRLLEMHLSGCNGKPQMSDKL